MNAPPNAAHPPWYRQFWPWALIAIPFLTVVASGITLWLAISHPDPLVVDKTDYNQLRKELRAQHVKEAAASQANPAPEPADGEP